MQLPGRIVENEQEHATYNADTGMVVLHCVHRIRIHIETLRCPGYFQVSLPKQSPGEHFADLDLHTKLMAAKLHPVSSAGKFRLGAPFQQDSATHMAAVPPSIEVVGGPAVTEGDCGGTQGEEWTFEPQQGVGV